MIYSKSSILVDENKREIQENGLELFNLMVNDGDVHQYIGSHIASHWHSRLEIFVLLSGKVRIDIEKETIVLEPGEGCFINANTLHAFTALTADACRYRSFVFAPDIVGGVPGSIYDTEYVRPILESGVPYLKFLREERNRLYFEQFDRAFQICLSEPFGYELEVRDALSKILLFILPRSQAAPERVASATNEKRLKEMLNWIEQNYHRKISTRQIAQTVNICTRECQRIFNQYLHYSPIAYVQRKRIYAAAQQLAATELAITDIGLNCGFTSPSYFSEQFRELVGCSPSEYRNAVRKRKQPEINSAEER